MGRIIIINWMLCSLLLTHLAMGQGQHNDPTVVHSVIIPMDTVGGLILLAAQVNKRMGKFVLDTGAKGMVLNSRYFSPDYVSSQQAVGLGGAISQVGTLLIDTFRLDDLVFSAVNAETVDLRQLERAKQVEIHGLIGYDLLRDFELMLNYRAQYVTLSRVNAQGELLVPLPHTLNKVDSFSFRLGGHIPIVEVYINGRIRKRMGIDTGAEYNLLHTQGNNDILEHLVLTRRMEVTGADQHSMEIMGGQLYRMSLGQRYRCAGMPTLLANLSQLQRIYGTELDGILGRAFLAPWVISINYRKQQLYLHPIQFIRP